MIHELYYLLNYIVRLHSVVVILFFFIEVVDILVSATFKSYTGRYPRSCLSVFGRYVVLTLD